MKALVEQCVRDGQQLVALGKVARAITPDDDTANDQDNSSSSSSRYPAIVSASQIAPQRAPLLHALAQMASHANPVEEEDADQSLPAAPRNISFVFIKPHACHGAVQELVERRFQQAHMRVERQGIVTSEDIDQRGLIDLHYAAIARYATKWAASEIPMASEAQTNFQKTFGVAWEAVGRVGRY